MSVKQGDVFTHHHFLDPYWTPDLSRGEKYRDAPKARMIVTSVQRGRVYFTYQSPDDVDRIGLWCIAKAEFESEYAQQIKENQPMSTTQTKNERGFITTAAGVTREAERSETGGIRTRVSPNHAWTGVSKQAVIVSFRPACPRCGTDRMNQVQARNALSRKDNATYVCNSCGTDEAMMNFTGGRDADVWPGFPDIATHYRSE